EREIAWRLGLMVNGRWPPLRFLLGTRELQDKTRAGELAGSTITAVLGLSLCQVLRLVDALPNWLVRQNRQELREGNGLGSTALLATCRSVSEPLQDAAALQRVQARFAEIVRPAAPALEANHNREVTHLRAAAGAIQPGAEQILRLLGEDPGQSSRDRPTGEPDPEALTSIYQVALDVLRMDGADRAELTRAASDILHLDAFMRFSVAACDVRDRSTWDVHRCFGPLHLGWR
ncbi:unnamed protein product, partial [Symbiodinium pilosum]